jgi:hypothetical protein
VNGLELFVLPMLAGNAGLIADELNTLVGTFPAVSLIIVAVGIVCKFWFGGGRSAFTTKKLATPTTITITAINAQSLDFTAEPPLFLFDN